MALPKSKYSDPLHSPGNEFTLDGKNYVGWYVITYQDKYFSGKTLTRDSKEIFPVEFEDTVDNNTKVFVEQVTEPTVDDRIEGVWRRYFIQNKNNLHIIEVKKERFQSYRKSAGYNTALLNWKLKGPADNLSINGYTYFGASHINRLNTEGLEKTIKGITEYIKDYSEFVE